MKEFETIQNYEKMREELEKKGKLDIDYQEKWNQVFEKSDMMKERFEEKIEEIEKMRKILTFFEEPFLEEVPESFYAPEEDLTEEAHEPGVSYGKSSEKKHKYCKNCGHEILFEADYCGNCGSKIS